MNAKMAPPQWFGVPFVIGVSGVISPSNFGVTVAVDNGVDFLMRLALFALSGKKRSVIRQILRGEYGMNGGFSRMVDGAENRGNSHQTAGIILQAFDAPIDRFAC